MNMQGQPFPMNPFSKLRKLTNVIEVNPLAKACDLRLFLLFLRDSASRCSSLFGLLTNNTIRVCRMVCHVAQRRNTSILVLDRIRNFGRKLCKCVQLA